MAEGQASATDEIEITPEMIEVGIYALMGFGGQDDFTATDPTLIVREIFVVMRRAEHQGRAPVP